MENEVRKILWDFKIQTDHQILERRSDQMLIYKNRRTCYFYDFAVSIEKKRKQKLEKYLDLTGEIKNCEIWK